MRQPARVRGLECALAKVTLENEFLKKPHRTASNMPRRESSLLKIAPLSRAFKEGLN
jgi:hypothetical protein